MNTDLPNILYSTEQIKTIEQFVIQSGMVSGYTLMERAGQAIFDYVQHHYPTFKKITVFCGGGNNGGDGYVVARLARQAGLDVCVYSVVETTELKNDALTTYQQFILAGGTVNPFENQVINCDLIIDALLGTGLSRCVTDKYEQAINSINQSQMPVISVDVPSGLNADTGYVMGNAVEANTTITFIGLKQGLFTGFAAQHTGIIIYASLDLPTSAWETVSSSITCVVPKPLLPRRKYAHKGNFGHVLVVGGNRGYSGAARLAGMAALRVGAGLVSIATHPDNASVMNAVCPELMCHGITSSKELAGLLTKATVVVVGTGLGQDDWATALFQTVLNTDKPMVIDADGLNLLVKYPCKKSNWILTPHVGEAARLLNVTTTAIQTNRFHAVQQLNCQYGGVVLLKGAGTLIASENKIAVSTTGNPGMASGGMGDVLAGVIAALLAQDMSLEDAAKQGAWGHGLAADLASQDGERGLLATDLLPFLRKLGNSLV